MDNIRGKKVDDALDILQIYQRKKRQFGWKNCLISAISNWEYKLGELDADDYDLYVKTAFVDQGPMLEKIQTCSSWTGSPNQKAYQSCYFGGREFESLLS